MQINREDLIKRLMLADASFLTFREKTVLEKNLDSPDALAIMSIDDISSMVKRTFGKAHWDAGYSLDQAAKNSIILEKLGINFAFYDSEDYPAMFTNIPFICDIRKQLIKENHYYLLLWDRYLNYYAKRKIICENKPFYYKALMLLSPIFYFRKLGVYL